MAQPTGMVISNIVGFCSFLNGTYLRHHDFDHGDRPTYRSEEKAPAGAGPAASQYVYLFYHTKNKAWVLGMNITESSGAAAYRRGSEQTPSAQKENTWCVSNKHGKFVSSEFTLCKPLYNSQTVSAEPVVIANSMSSSKATSREEARKMLMEANKHQPDGGVGCFVLRNSSSIPNAFVLSVLLTGNRMDHILVQANEGGYTLSEMQFQTLKQLIEHYKTNPLKHRVGKRSTGDVMLGECVHGSALYDDSISASTKAGAGKSAAAKLEAGPRDSLASFGGETIYEELAKMGYNTFKLKRSSVETSMAHEELYINLDEVSATAANQPAYAVPSEIGSGGGDAEDEMYAIANFSEPVYAVAGGALAGAGHEQKYATLYAAAETYARAVTNKDAYEQTKLCNQTPAENQARLLEAYSAMEKHRSAYDALFLPWSTEPWVLFLKEMHDDQKSKFEVNPAQPNPWVSDGIDTKSKSYLIRVLKIFEDTTSDASPIKIVDCVCNGVVAALGGSSVAAFRCGPVKKRGRIFEKVLMLAGLFDMIRDYGRGYIIVKRGHFKKMAMVPTLLDANPEVDFVRAKNRFDPQYNPKDSAGYRDYQIIIRTKVGGWLFELQVIPEEILDLKESLGHDDYTEFRFIVEAAKRAAAKNANSPYNLVADARGESPYDLVADGRGESPYGLTGDL